MSNLGNQRILEAVESGDLDEITKAFESSNDPKLLPKIAEHAAAKGRSRIIEWCLEEGFRFKQPSFNDDFYHKVCEGRSLDVFEVLIRHGFDLNAHESEYMGDALVTSTREGDVELTHFLLEHGHNPNTHNTIYPGELEAITYAVAWENASLDNLQLLLDHGAEIKETGAAIAAAEVGNMKALKMLVDHGADLEESVFWGLDGRNNPFSSEGTALYRACRYGQVEAAEYLLSQGANGNARDAAGRSCLQVAQERGHQQIAELLQTRSVVA